MTTPMIDEVHEWTRDDCCLSTDKSRLDFGVIHDFLAHCYWSPGIPMDLVRKAADNSLVFGLYTNDHQIGYARVVTDFARHAYLADVFVVPEHRGQGLGKWMIECVLSCPSLKDVPAIMLATRDAHGLYEPFGFKTPTDASALMFAQHAGLPWKRADMIRE